MSRSIGIDLEIRRQGSTSNADCGSRCDNPRSDARTDRRRPSNADRENGFVRFNNEWLHLHADARRHALTILFDGDPKNPPKLTWGDVIALLTDHEDFRQFRGLSERFWQQVRQMGETSRYHFLLNEMWASGLSPREFARTLPPNERMVFLARFQIDQAFGSSFFASDGVTLTEQGQARLMQFLTGGNMPTSEPRVIPQPQNPANQNGEETFLTRVVNSATAESPASRRDGGVAQGTALINGQFVSAENFREIDNYQINTPITLASYLTEIQESFSAGATGAMFGAVVGDVVPNGGPDAGGILGLVSGIMAGFDAERALESLGTGGQTFRRA